MDLTEWRAQQQAGEPFVLPSDLVVYLRRVDLLDLAERGGIPAPLVGLATEFVGPGVKLDLGNFTEYSQMVDLVVQAAVVSPALAEAGDETHLALHELPVLDRLAIFNWANEGSARLVPFRAEPAGAAPAA